MNRDEQLKLIRHIEEDCRESGRELLTPMAAAKLFGISLAAVRMARTHGHIDTYVRLSVTGKPVELILLQSALRYWRKTANDIEDALNSFRRNGTTMAIDAEFFNVLHSEPVAIRPRDSDRRLDRAI